MRYRRLVFQLSSICLIFKKSKQFILQYFLFNILNLQTKSKTRLKHILVLLARIFAIICLVSHFHPYIPVIKNKTFDAKNQVVAMYIDNSFSMMSEGFQTVICWKMPSTEPRKLLLLYRQIQGLLFKITIINRKIVSFKIKKLLLKWLNPYQFRHEPSQ